MMKKSILPLVAIATLFLSHFSGAQTTQPAAPPTDAVVLFDGTQKSLDDNWTNRRGKPVDWTVADGEMTSQKLDIITKQKFQDYQLHVEFNEPNLPPEVKGQERGNSGVYMQGRYEIQVLDSYGIAKPDKGDCGAVYGRHAPAENACLPPGQWQTYDITYKAAKYDADGKKITRARVTVIQNGKKIQDDVEIGGPTGSELLRDGPDPGPIMLQYHRNSVKFRNVWIIPTPAK